jgi:heme a synthase
MKAHRIWLLSIIHLIFIIIVVGGITRLTQSGLSMVDWRPVLGILPPLNESQWLTIFDQYKEFPQYQHMYPNMTVLGFKKIFFWEYLHRILGRIIGLSIIIPFLIFTFKKTLPQALAKQGRMMIILVIAQGLMGWFMVKSGLLNTPNVSHYRLAAHLGLALLLLQYCFWALLNLAHPRSRMASHPLLKQAKHFTILLGIQIMYGAFVAGLKAGYGFNTWPKMGDHWLPSSAWALSPFSENFFSNPVMIQFMHRSIGIVLFIAIIQLFIQSKKTGLTPRQSMALNIVFISTICQVILGIVTLLSVVPISLALLHQSLAIVVLSGCTHLIFVLKRNI